MNGPDLNLAAPEPRNGVLLPDRASPPGRTRVPPARPLPPRDSASEGRAGFSVDIGSLLLPAARRWPWILIGIAVGATLGAMLGTSMFKESFTATAKLERYVPPLATDAYNPQPLTVPTLVHLIQSPDFFLRVGRKLHPPLSGAEVAGRLNTVPERNTEILSVIASGANPRDAVNLANLYTQEVIAFAKEAQRRDAFEAEHYVAIHLQETEADIANARKNMPPLPALIPMLDPSTLTSANTPDRLTLKIQAAQDELAALLAKYTDNHPAVKMKRSEIAALQAQEQLGLHAAIDKTDPTNPSTPPPAGSREEWEIAMLHLRTLENLHTGLINRQHAIDLFKAEPPGNFRVELPAALDNVTSHRAKAKILLLGVLCGLLGGALAFGEIVGREFLDRRLKTAADVARVTRLPVISTLGNLGRMSPEAREDWAFHTWIKLQDHLSHSPNHGLVCGFTSARPGDGRSTWINLLAGAARRCGFRVLTIATRPTEVSAGSAPAAEPVVAGAAAGKANGAPSSALLSTLGDALHGTEFASDSAFTAMTASALFTPAEVTEKLTSPDADPIVHIPLPGWTWNLARRKQWQDALGEWRKIDNVVILVELPPASVHESILLASNLPNVLWLADAGKSEAAETRRHLDTLRHARCHLVGAVVNRAPTPAAHGRFSRWVGCLAPFVATLVLAGHSLMAGEISRPPAVAPESSPSASVATFSADRMHRAAWQTRYTLGPGDILNFAVYGNVEFTREEVPIGPDGKISYLEARDVQAAGLTIDELREKLSSELGKFHREPQVYVVPFAYRSKKYYVLGKVAERGVFPLDRPMTLIEAIARARGIETGIAADRTLVELADLSHAFVARGGQHLPVDFQKLFEEGDLSQNIALEPEDYIFLPTASLKEVYVLGSVVAPGAHSYTSEIGAIAAISSSGGFNRRAWKNRILVIRGSLNHPETFVLDATDVLAARTPDLRLQPRDIVYVSDRPWARAEELLDTAAAAFVTSATVTATGIHVNGINQ
ncbi:MAG TPA: polysaccharide biosynthesis/export family protein [Opitutaceae bacterium]|nr:polysaccharide biosynthesis/export family protein [Opitutaceae bacterium]